MLGKSFGIGQHQSGHSFRSQVQYYGWALKNQSAFLPSRKQLDIATQLVEDYRFKLKGILAIDYVVPDYYAKRPKSCMGGWGRQFLNITPAGKVLPCHAAESLNFLSFDNVKNKSLSWIWQNSEAFNKFRGTSWMPEPCQSCDRKEIDWGGCRCQAFALTGIPEATDPTCELSPYRSVLDEPLSRISEEIPEFILYWSEKGEESDTWNSKFIAQVRRQWAKTQHLIDNSELPEPISPSWKPSQDFYEVLALTEIDRGFADSTLSEFILYWRETGQAHNSWNSKFIQHVKYQWQKQQGYNRTQPLKDIDQRIQSSWEIKPTEQNLTTEVSSKEKIRSKLEELKKKHLI